MSPGSSATARNTAASTADGGGSGALTGGGEMTCRILLWGFALAYVGALDLLLIGTFGLFGSNSGRLAGRSNRASA